MSGLKNDKIVFKSPLRKYLLTHVFCSIEEFLSNDYRLFIFRRVFFYLSISSCSSFILTIFKLLYSYLLSVMLDPVFILLSLEHIFCTSIYFCLICFLTKLLWAPYVFWHVSYSPSVDKCWISEVYMCVCTSMCIVLSSRDRQCSLFRDARILSTLFHPHYF